MIYAGYDPETRCYVVRCSKEVKFVDLNTLPRGYKLTYGQFDAAFIKRR